MNKKTIGIIVFGFLLLATACIQPDTDLTSQGVLVQPSDIGGDEIQLQYEGIGPLEITPDPGSGENSTESGDQVEGVISSSGERLNSGSESTEPGFVESAGPSKMGLVDEEEMTVEWLTYVDQAYAFSIDYPNIYTVLPETEDLTKTVPGKVHQVRFQDKQLVSGDTAEFELPLFQIEVFEPGDKSLQEFIEQNEAGGQIDEYQGEDLDGFHVSYSLLIAPNEFYYFASQNYIYKLTPLGPFSPDMVQSFNIQ